jgi:hypothetical protein
VKLFNPKYKNVIIIKADPLAVHENAYGRASGECGGIYV